jgi:hypothetical protein
MQYINLNQLLKTFIWNSKIKPLAENVFYFIQQNKKAALPNSIFYQSNNIQIPYGI